MGECHISFFENYILLKLGMWWYVHHKFLERCMFKTVATFPWPSSCITGTLYFMILTCYLQCISSNHVPWVYIVGWSKALNQYTIQCQVCSTTQCWWVGSSTCCKPNPWPSSKGIARSTNRGWSWPVWQGTLTVPIHSPDGETAYVSGNIASECEVFTRTGDGSCSQLPSNNNWSGIQN